MDFNSIMIKIIAVAFGGALGSLGRYFIAVVAEKTVSMNFPLATFLVNVIGSLLIGFCWNYFDRIHISNEFRLFLFTGFLGGFTTFSTFARESAQFIKAHEPFNALYYIIASNTLGLCAVFLGIYISQRFMR